MNKKMLATVAMVSSLASAQTGTPKPIPVTPDNFVRAETDR
jgi:hypothetical protein